MSYLQANRIKQLCPDTWVARAYGEYLSDCAAAQAELLSAITNGISNDALTSVIDARSDLLSDEISDITSAIYSYMADSGVSNPEQRNLSDPVVVDAYEHLLQNDPVFADKVVNICTNFPQCGDSTTLIVTLDSNTVDDLLALDTQVQSSIDSVVSEELSALGLPSGSAYTLNECYVNYGDLLKEMIKHGALKMSNDNITSVFRNVDGGELPSLSLTSDEILEEIKTSFASAVAWSQGFLALDSASVSEAIQKFEVQVGTIISDVQEKFASTVAQVKGLISSSNARVSNFLETASEWLGWNQVAADTFTTVDNTDIMEYTGASPLSGINLKTAKGIAVATGKTLAAVGLALWNGVKALGKKVWKKIKPYAKAITTDPIDIEIANTDDKSYTIGNFMFNYTDEAVRFPLYVGAGYILPSSVLKKWRSILSNMSDSWYGIETYMFECCFRIRNASLIALDPSGYAIECDVDYKFRFKCINIDKAISADVLRVTSDTAGGMTSTNLESWGCREHAIATDVAAWFAKYSKFVESGDLYYDDVTNEVKMFMGFIAAGLISADAVCAAYREMSNSFVEEYRHGFDGCQLTYMKINRFPETVSPYTATISPSNSFYLDATEIWSYHYGANLPVSDQPNYSPSSVNNGEFVSHASGYNSSIQNTTPAANWRWFPGDTRLVHNPSDPEGHSWYNYINLVSISTIVLPLIAMFFMQQFDRVNYPADFVFLPYCKGSYDFSDGRYYIKTDTENVNVAQLLVNAIVVIAVVVAAVLICKAVLKVIKTKKIAKYNNYMGQCDNAIWSNNKTLSYREQRKYLRYSKRVEKLTNASSGFLGSSSSNSVMKSAIGVVKDHVVNESSVPANSASNAWSQKQYDDLSQVQRLIKGSI